MPILKQDKIPLLAASKNPNFAYTTFSAVVTLPPGVYRYVIDKSRSNQILSVEGHIESLMAAYGRKDPEKVQKLIESFKTTRQFAFSLPFLHVLMNWKYWNNGTEGYSLSIDLARLGFSFSKLDPINIMGSKIYRLPFPNIYPSAKISLSGLPSSLSESIGKRKEVTLSNLIEDAIDIASLFWVGNSADPISLHHFLPGKDDFKDVYPDITQENYSKSSVAKWASMFCPSGVFLATEFDPKYTSLRKTNFFKEAEKEAPTVGFAILERDIQSTRPVPCLGLKDQTYPVVGG